MAHMQARAVTVRNVAERMRERGIALVVTVVPDKARIQNATLGHAPRAAQTLTRYRDFAAALHAQGVEIVDLNAALAQAAQAGPVFFRTDTHWNQAGAAIAAKAVAAAAHLPPSTEYRTEAEPDLSDGPGDLVRLMSLETLPDRWAPWLRPLPDRQHLEHTVPAEPPADSGGLLDDTPAVPVALIGSSFSLNGNFAGRLEEALHAQVANFGRLGGGFAGAARDYFDGAAIKETPPRLLVWEIPERVVGQDLDEADHALARWAQASGR
jgi:alginate O-acetyltransferase complex protein AlgJ